MPKRVTVNVYNCSFCPFYERVFRPRSDNAKEPYCMKESKFLKEEHKPYGTFVTMPDWCPFEEVETMEL